MDSQTVGSVTGSDKLARIKEIGFTRAGKWAQSPTGTCAVCETGTCTGLDFSLESFFDAKNLLYAFVVNDQLKYVGKTVQPLHKRMAGYKAPGATQSTNIKNHHNIKAELAGRKRVEIFALPDNGLLCYGRFPLNLAAGLEDSLIRYLQPPWNGGQKETPEETLVPTVPPSAPVEQPFTGTMNDLTAGSLLEFAKSLEAQQLETPVQGKPFTLTVTMSGIEFLPASSASGEPCRESRDGVERFCDEYKQSGSKQKKHYDQMTGVASYLLTLVHLFEQESLQQPRAQTKPERLLNEEQQEQAERRYEQIHAQVKMERLLDDAEYQRLDDLSDEQFAALSEATMRKFFATSKWRFDQRLTETSTEGIVIGNQTYDELLKKIRSGEAPQAASTPPEGGRPPDADATSRETRP